MTRFATHRSWGRSLLLATLLVVGASAAHAQVSPLWDHYRTYAATLTALSAPPGTIGLIDQFGDWQYTVPLELVRFSNPDEKYHAPNLYPINDPRLHYTWWYLGSEPFTRPSVLVTNQFGPQIVDVFGDEIYLLNPAIKNDPIPEIPVANHYKCYRCQGDPPGISVVLSDQFKQRTATVLEPVVLCNPAVKTVEPGGFVYPIVDHNQHYVGYLIEPQEFAVTAMVSDQFIRDQQLLIFNDFLLLVPSEKHDATPTESGTWGRVKKLYR